MVHSEREISWASMMAEARRRLEPAYGAGEARAMAMLIVHALKGWSHTDLIVHGDRKASPESVRRVAAILERLANGEPLQYILGHARFYGMDLAVSPAVLIPRPETEELVDLVVKQNPGKDLRVLDVGTGSGAVAIALSRNLLFPEVTAIDISPQALEVARRNAAYLNAGVRFIHADVFRFPPQEGAFDIMVSNPPYVMEKEKKDMEANVLLHEPHNALFVPDGDPLLFYRRIAETGLSALSPGGRLYFEINPLCAGALHAMLEDMGYSEVRLYKDISNRWRLASARNDRKG